jgi:hypothetical protein
MVHLPVGTATNREGFVRRSRDDGDVERHRNGVGQYVEHRAVGVHDDRELLQLLRRCLARPELYGTVNSLVARPNRRIDGEEPPQVDVPGKLHGHGVEGNP